MTALTEPQNTDRTDPDNATAHRWTRSGARPDEPADPLARLVGFRMDGVRAAGELARQNGRMLRVVRYLRTPEDEVGAQSEALELVSQSRHWLVRDDLCVDPVGLSPLEDREGLSAALDLLRAGFADGLVTPTYEHISPDLREYEYFLKEIAARGWFVALALPETDQ